MRRFLAAAFAVASLLASPLVAGTAEEEIRRITALSNVTIEGEPICAERRLDLFYARRGFQPAWFRGAGVISGVDELIASIGAASEHGLDPDDYHLRAIITLRDTQPASTRDLARADVLFTDAFLLYANHLVSGKVNPETIDPEWCTTRRDADVGASLDQALASDSVRDTLAALAPSHRGYAALRAALERYRQISAGGGWPTVPPGRTIASGHRGWRVMLLKQRLAATGDLPQSALANDLFDVKVEEGVRRFQSRHGIVSDGRAGSATIRTLNVPVETRIQTIIANLERWRWLPQDLGERYVVVNIAAFELRVVDKDATMMSMKTIVGKDFQRTPVFSSAITEVVLNPFWNVPKSIAVKEMVKEIRRNPDYLRRENIKVFENGRELNPSMINWWTVRGDEFDFRQEPGPRNSLGRIKFNFPNRFSVYLHDTPARSLFDLFRRAFSHGCIRIERSMDLAEYLLGEQGWTREQIERELETARDEHVALKVTTPVHILYWTAWADDDGSIEFRDDVYHRDERLDRALAERVSR